MSSCPESPPDGELDPAALDALTGTRLDVHEAQRSYTSPSWQRLSGKVTILLQAQFGRVRVPPPLDFDDFTSEVLLVVLRDLGGFQDRGRGSFQAWVQRLAHNRLNDLWRFYEAHRRGGRRGVATGGDDGLEVLENVPDQNVEEGEKVAQFRELQQAELDCVARLPRELQAVYLLRRQDEKSFREVADTVGRANEATVRSLYKRARDFVRRCIESKMDALGIRVDDSL